jgi:hypothetical protein
MRSPVVTISLPVSLFQRIRQVLSNNFLTILFLVLLGISVFSFTHFWLNGLGLAYNDARSHLDIGRRVVEGLKPGLAQIGSVWLPLPHLLMTPTIWNDFMWHSGLAGALPSMASFIFTDIVVVLYLRKLKVGLLGQIVGAVVFALNLNAIYLQSTAMTEMILMATMTVAAYEFLRWQQTDQLVYLVRTAFWVMLSTLVRYDGWFLFVYILGLVLLQAWRRKGAQSLEGMFIFYCSLAGLGIVLWFLWNTLIFQDPLYFISGPYSARAQQILIEEAGLLTTKGNVFFSLTTYVLDTLYNIGVIPVMLGVIGFIKLMLDRKQSVSTRLATTTLAVPFIFNVLALYLGQSVIFLQGISGDTWFNVRYGLLSLPAIAMGIGYLTDQVKALRWVILSLLLLFSLVSITSYDVVTIDDATVGSSQKNVQEVSGWLSQNAGPQAGFILISAASHDAIIFSSGLPMIRFIHEGTGKYWENATVSPDRWARWIIMRTNDENDLTFKLINESGQLYKYDLVESYPFADIYELKDEYLAELNTEPTLGRQR